MSTTRRRRVWPFFLMMAFLLLTPVVCLAIYLSIRFDALMGPRIVEYMAANLSDEQRRELYDQLAEQVPGMWDPVPEPLVGRIMQRNISITHKQAEVVSNNAGMRSRRPYVPKPEGVYRIVCLGDSFVYGEAGKEEDRLGDQIEEILRDLDVRVDGKEIEVYSLGLGSWTGINEANYLISRFSEYRPDLVLVLMVRNDISDGSGVRGTGQISNDFSPQFRSHGSGVFVHAKISREFRLDRGEAFLKFGMGPESESRWQQTFQAWNRLEGLLDRSGGRMVFGLSEASPIYAELAKHYYQANDLHSPFILTRFFGERLPHDSHPSREGHRILASHFLHVVAAQGWLPIEADRLPPLHEGLSLQTDQPAEDEKLARMQREAVETHLTEEIAFDRLTQGQVLGFLGGIYRSSYDEPLRSRPYAAPKSAFLLKRDPDATEVALEINVPRRPELFPFDLDMHINGKKVTTLTIQDESGAGLNELRGRIPDGSEPYLEVMLLAKTYWTLIENHTMKSFQFVRATQH